MGLKGELKCIEGMVLGACSFGGILGINPEFECKHLRYEKKYFLLHIYGFIYKKTSPLKFKEVFRNYST